jgi:hypothetical protein
MNITKSYQFEELVLVRCVWGGILLGIRICFVCIKDWEDIAEY